MTPRSSPLTTYAGPCGSSPPGRSRRRYARSLQACPAATAERRRELAWSIVSCWSIRWLTLSAIDVRGSDVAPALVASRGAGDGRYAEQEDANRTAVSVDRTSRRRTAERSVAAFEPEADAAHRLDVSRFATSSPSLRRSRDVHVERLGGAEPPLRPDLAQQLLARHDLPDPGPGAQDVELLASAGAHGRPGTRAGLLVDPDGGGRFPHRAATEQGRTRASSSASRNGLVT